MTNNKQNFQVTSNNTWNNTHDVYQNCIQKSVKHLR